LLSNKNHSNKNQTIKQKSQKTSRTCGTYLFYRNLRTYEFW